MAKRTTPRKPTRSMLKKKIAQLKLGEANDPNDLDRLTDRAISRPDPIAYLERLARGRAGLSTASNGQDRPPAEVTAVREPPPVDPANLQQSRIREVTITVPVGDFLDSGYGVSSGRPRRRIHERKLGPTQGWALGRLLLGMIRDGERLADRNGRAISSAEDAICRLLEILNDACDLADRELAADPPPSAVPRRRKRR